MMLLNRWSIMDLPIASTSKHLMVIAAKQSMGFCLFFMVVATNSAVLARVVSPVASRAFHPSLLVQVAPA